MYTGNRGFIQVQSQRDLGRRTYRGMPENFGKIRADVQGERMGELACPI
jgi:hypothetical protein